MCLIRLVESFNHFFDLGAKISAMKHFFIQYFTIGCPWNIPALTVKESKYGNKWSRIRIQERTRLRVIKTSLCKQTGKEMIKDEN